MVPKIKDVLRGRKSLQRFFSLIHQYSLSGMNIGTGAGFATSGEKFALEFIREKLAIDKPHGDLVIFDVGANIGEYALEASKLFTPNVTIYAFEPSKVTFAKLTEAVLGQNNITTHQIALSDTTGHTTLHSNGDLSGLASINKRNLSHYDIAFENSESVSMTTLDAFCEQHNISEIDFLKLDVEGHELSVLHGAKNLLQNKIRFIQFEFGGANIDSRTFFQDFFYLLHDNYTLYRVLSDGLYEITTYNERFEIFLTSNYLAIRK